MSEKASLHWRAVAEAAVPRLRSGGHDHAEQVVRWLVEEATGYEGADDAGVLDRPVPAQALARFDRWLERLEAGEPLQYVLGHWSFRQLDLMVDRRVLIPRPETEQVVEVALTELDRVRAASDQTVIVADLGTGSGAIALSIAFERRGVEVWAVDRDQAALDVARANLAGLGRAGTNVRIACGSWFEAFDTSLQGMFGLVVSNPPYVATGEELPPVVVNWEPAGALVAGEQGTEAIDAILAEAGDWLRPDGALVVELAPHQAEPMAARALALGWGEVEVATDLAGHPRTLVARGFSR